MTTRRELFRMAAQTVAAGMLGSHRVPAMAPDEPYRATARSGRPLLDLQQRFVDLRFGMFLHFNMATFQDREWGDPTSPADLFHPTALDTDQWAAAGQSANMPWGVSQRGLMMGSVFGRHGQRQRVWGRHRIRSML